MQIKKNRYHDFLMQVKARIQTSQVRAVLSVNAELIHLYWDIGWMIDKKQKEKGGVRLLSRSYQEILEMNCLKLRDFLKEILAI